MTNTDQTMALPWRGEWTARRAFGLRPDLQRRRGVDRRWWWPMTDTGRPGTIEWAEQGWPRWDLLVDKDLLFTDGPAISEDEAAARIRAALADVDELGEG